MEVDSKGIECTTDDIRAVDTRPYREITPEWVRRVQTQGPIAPTGPAVTEFSIQKPTG
jgi:hypothetical protein